MLLFQFSALLWSLRFNFSFVGSILPRERLDFGFAPTVGGNVNVRDLEPNTRLKCSGSFQAVLALRGTFNMCNESVEDGL